MKRGKLYFLKISVPTTVINKNIDIFLYHERSMVSKHWWTSKNQIYPNKFQYSLTVNITVSIRVSIKQEKISNK